MKKRIKDLEKEQGINELEENIKDKCVPHMNLGCYLQ